MNQCSFSELPKNEESQTTHIFNGLPGDLEESILLNGSENLASSSSIYFPAQEDYHKVEHPTQGVDTQEALKEQGKALKRKLRLIRNRESADISRKKRKEYVASLEEQVNDVTEMNLALKSDNANLKQQMIDLNLR